MYFVILYREKVIVSGNKLFLNQKSIQLLK